ncbi:fumarylacetoacetase [Sulfitobacter sp. KE29]|uniref:fumarylacetoacetase n=1 Tax=Sulfitobacter TaxID=60136 RepID=UPI0007C2EC1A|nr:MULTISPECIES: fumarylacetoacetase [Sulfitobacter]KZY49055.1 fumarylacetoacetase [Sulfitobacter sp. HI0054]MBO9437867.1 fumarylacetoacetase [Sulfitobacter sp. R18_2]MDF3418822.1 fumarylacetoacetase [Sulfitobacter sp. Ks38]MDF3426093.1 fumarylacetoacetase [Sulfitobacter sp. KE29]MDF3429673.1 fumarylacetoacetase [Sulfitobacter sp. S46]
MTLMTSWVESANSATTDFPLNNLPYGVFSTNQLEARCGVAIGDQIVDMAALEEEGLITLAEEPLFDVPYWNDVMDLGPTAWASLRSRLIELLSADAPDQAAVAPHLVPMGAAQLHMPMMVSEYTDFYAGKHHATNVGTMFRGAENALPPNWLHIPIGYNGRASTVVVSGTEITRPNGQLKAPEAEAPHFGPCQKLDIELEMGAIVGTSTEMGQPIRIDAADEMIFGYVLLNDWSARDIQAWEYQPLGPFQAKAFATSISPWIVTRDALEPFRTSTPAREKDLLPYLRESKPGLFDIDLSVMLQPEGGEAEEIARTNYREMYYSAAQQLTHHASSGCAMNAGDLLGSGTISGPEKSQRGSLLELSWGGKEPITLADGSTRSFVEDGDTLTLTGHAQGDGFRVGFGACTGKVRPAIDFS